MTLSPAQLYRQQQDPRNEIIYKYSPLVKKIALHLKARLPASVQVDDLIQSGMIGLLDAASNFEGGQGATFETYASIRIRGAMLDELRRSDWAPRHVHRNDRTISETISKLSHRLGKEPSEQEIADEMNISLDEYRDMLLECNSCKMVGIEDLGVTDDVIADTSKRVDLSDPVTALHRKEFVKALAEAIKNLPEREAIIVSLYYDEEMNLKEIGAVLSISESRTSQLLSQAIIRLGSMMKEWTHSDSE